MIYYDLIHGISRSVPVEQLAALLDADNDTTIPYGLVSPMVAAAELGRMDFVTILFERNHPTSNAFGPGVNKGTVLSYALLRLNKPALCTDMLTAGFSIHEEDRCGWTALMHAANTDTAPFSSVLYLVHHGAVVNQESSYPTSATQGYGTALLVAAMRNDPELVRLFLAMGATICARQSLNVTSAEAKEVTDLMAAASIFCTSLVVDLTDPSHAVQPSNAALRTNWIISNPRLFPQGSVPTHLLNDALQQLDI